MKRCLLFVLAALLAAPALGAAQTSDEELIARATMAAPQRVRGGVGVVRWDANNNRGRREGERERPGLLGPLGRAGHGALRHAMLRGGQPAPLRAEPEVRVRGGRRRRAAGDDGRGRVGGQRVLAKFGTVWYSLNGPDQENAGLHTTIAVPNATAETVGLPDSRRSDGLWLMAGGHVERPPDGAGL